MELIHKYFPEITAEQQKHFAMLHSLYTEWNDKINLISRKDIDLLYERHILHSLGIAKVMKFAPGTKVLDVGTGGGFPGIPLAILFPDSQFHLVDSIGKKISAVNGVASSLGLTNVKAENIRAEQLKGKYHFIVSRAVTRLASFVEWVKDKFEKDQFNPLSNGILYLKGGDLEEELKEVKRKVTSFDLSQHFEEEFFETKKVIYLPAF